MVCVKDDMWSCDWGQRAYDKIESCRRPELIGKRWKGRERHILDSTLVTKFKYINISCLFTLRRLAILASCEDVVFNIAVELI